MREVKLGAIADLISSNVDKKSRKDETPVRLVNYTDVYYGSVLNSDRDFMEATASSQQIERVGLRHGDVIFTKDSESPDDIGIPAIANSPDGDMVCGYHLTIARPHPEFVFSKYLYWYLNSAQAKRHWEQTANGVTRFSIGSSATSALPIYLPPLPTQRAIADYLDRETAEIDGMRADLDEMERLLEERRTVLIQRLINQRIDADATPMSIAIQGHVGGSGLVGGQTSAGHDETGILKTSAISSGRFSPAQNRLIDPGQVENVPIEHFVKSGDLLFNRLNSPEYVGAMSYVGEVNSSLIFSDKIWRLLLGPQTDPKYLAMWSKTPAYRKQVEFSIVGTSHSMQSLGYSTFQKFRIFLPPLAEQRRIADEIDRETAEIDSMLEEITELRDLLVERRAAVISAAVTGQIDIPASLDDKDEPHA